MRIGIPAEIYPGETRVAATPETVKKLSAGGRHAIAVQSGAGVHAAIPDEEFAAAGATKSACTTSTSAVPSPRTRRTATPGTAVGVATAPPSTARLIRQ